MTLGRQDSILFGIFQENIFRLDKRRLKLLFLMIQAISTVGSVNLVKIAAALKTDICQSGNYRRIQRFIHNVRVDFKVLGPFIVRLAGIAAPYTVLMDRTNRKFGIVNINFLVLSIKGDNWSVPVMWVLLPKKGNSSEQERIQILSDFIKVFGSGKIYSLIADREFVGSQWIKYLNSEEIPYDIRIRENLKILYRGRLIRVSKLFSKLKVGETRTINHIVKIGGAEVYIQGRRIINSKNHKQEYLIVISYSDPEQSIERYGERWYIESMFKDLKSNGFNLEDTHVVKLDRLETLMFILVIAYTWMIKIGKIVLKRNPGKITVKKHGRRSKSVFRLGFDEFLRSVCTLNLSKISFFLKVLSCT